MTRWQRDDEPASLTPAHGRQLGGNDLDVPVQPELGLWIEITEAARREGDEVLPQHRLVLGRRRVFNHPMGPFCRAAVELQDGALAESMRDDFLAPPLLAKQLLQEVGG